MFNLIAVVFLSYLVGVDGPLKGNAPATTPAISESSRVPTIFGFDFSKMAGRTNMPLHWGFIVSIIIALLVFWLLYRTPLGFEIRTVGLSPDAALYSGMSISKCFIIAMAASGMIAGIAGAFEVMGNPNYGYQYTISLGASYGFNSIAIALLAKSNPLIAVPVAFIYSALQSGASQMQFQTIGFDGRQLPGDLISIVQALVIIFISADSVIRWIYGIKPEASKSQTSVLRGWGKNS